MRTLAFIDYAVIIAYVGISLTMGLLYTKRASSSVENFFLSGRSLPWWLIGISMAATNFAIDTPLAITKFVFQRGVAGVWFFWAFAITVLLATFLFSKLWRRAEILTDAEIVEHRYSGSSAAFLRLFKGFYFGVLINCFVMGWVFLALMKIMKGVTDLNMTAIVVIFTIIAFVYTVASGFYGVVITDFAQYIIAFLGSILLAVLAVKEVGGLHNLLHQLQVMYPNSGVTDFFPNPWLAAKWMPMSLFLLYILVQWWSYKYSDGGGKHIQRMSAAKNEKHAVGGTFLFSILFYGIQVWPWIITALCSLVIFGKVADPETTYPMMMAKVLPAGILGLMVVAMLGAFMSTIDTHLNLGSSYMINDIYRRFLIKDRTEKHYVLMSRLFMLLQLAIAILLANIMDSVGAAWQFIQAFCAGAALTWILRWLWWRVNAWSEFSAMLTSAIVATTLNFMFPKMSFEANILTILAITTIVWLLVTYLTPPVEEAKLAEFVRKVRPSSPGWNYIYRKYDIPPAPSLLSALLNWGLGLLTFFGVNFGIGSLILKNTIIGLMLLTMAAVCFAVITLRLRREDDTVTLRQHQENLPTTR